MNDAHIWTKYRFIANLFILKLISKSSYLHATDILIPF